MNKLVYFVDDDKMLLNLMEYTFQCFNGVKVKTFHSGEECLNNLETKPQLIVLDHYMGDEKDLNGYDTLLKLKKNYPDIPVVILSSEYDKTIIDKFIMAGADKYIVKNDYFIDILSDYIGNHVAA